MRYLQLFIRLQDRERVMNSSCVQDRHQLCEDNVQDTYACSCPCHLKGENND